MRQSQQQISVTQAAPLWLLPLVLTSCDAAAPCWGVFPPMIAILLQQA